MSAEHALECGLDDSGAWQCALWCPSAWAEADAEATAAGLQFPWEEREVLDAS